MKVIHLAVLPKCNAARSPSSADSSAMRPSAWCSTRPAVCVASDATITETSVHITQPLCQKMLGITSSVEPIIVFHSVKTMPAEPVRFCRPEPARMEPCGRTRWRAPAACTPSRSEILVIMSEPLLLSESSAENGSCCEESVALALTSGSLRFERIAEESSGSESQDRTALRACESRTLRYESSHKPFRHFQSRKLRHPF